MHCRYRERLHQDIPQLSDRTHEIPGQPLIEAVADPCTARDFLNWNTQPPLWGSCLNHSPLRVGENPILKNSFLRLVRNLLSS